ncbi:MAG: ComEC/Rec2 family competence protein, partial [Patescibacteria group bacterium]
DQLKISCRLAEPYSPPGSVFQYDKYLARVGVWSSCNYATLDKISSGVGNPVLAKIFIFKSFLNSRVNLLWREPESSLMSGLLYGARSSLPKYLVDDFSRTGVSHIVAVSGFNITIIAVVLMNLLVYFGLYRQRAFYIVVATIILFVIFAGFTASAIRAAVMGIVVLVAKQVGRGSATANVLIFTVAMMQVINPYLLIWDVGFQLSFLALLGLIYIAPVINLIINCHFKSPRSGGVGLKAGGGFANVDQPTPTPPKRGITPRDDNWAKLKILRETLISTLSAIIATLPLMLYQFGTLSLVAPLVNILILWTVPWLMLAGAAAIGVGMILFPVGQFFAFVTHFGLSYVIMVVQFFGEQSWSHVTAPIPLWLMGIMYAILIFGIRYYEKNKSI